MTMHLTSTKTVDTNDHGQGIFTMPEINEMSRLPSLTAAKLMAKSLVTLSKATQKNKDKANAMIDKARNMTSLLTGMTNFNLAHQGLKVIR